MVEGVTKEVALTLIYMDGIREVGAATPEAQAQAFLEHLAGQGYIVRPRDGARVRLAPEPLEQKRVSSAKIRAMRVALGLSLAQLAQRAGLVQETIARLESGRTCPHTRTVSAIMDALAAARAEAASLPG